MPATKRYAKKKQFTGKRAYARTAKSTGRKYASKPRARKPFVKRQAYKKRYPVVKVVRQPAIPAYNIQTMAFDCADYVQVVSSLGTVGSVDTVGKLCAYGYAGITAAGGILQGLGSLEHLVPIMNQLISGQTGTGISNKMNMIKSWQVYEIMNQTTSNVKLTAYKCMFRRDVPQNGASNYTNVLNILGSGFYQRGITTGGAYGGNQGLIRDELTPFDSDKFTGVVNVLSKTTTVMDPGSARNFKLNHGPEIINFQHYYTQTATPQLPSAGSRDVARRRGEMFYLFKITGLPADSFTNPTQLTFSLPKIDMITKTHYEFCQVNPAAPNITLTTPIGYTTVLNTDVGIINNDSGLKVKQEFA